VVEILSSCRRGDRGSCCGLLHYEGPVQSAVCKEIRKKVDSMPKVLSCRVQPVYTDVNIVFIDAQSDYGGTLNRRELTIIANRALSTITFTTNLFSSRSNIPKL
jgi:hypothetical protein